MPQPKSFCKAYAPNATAPPRLLTYSHPRFWPTWLAIGSFRFLSLFPTRARWLFGVALGECAYRFYRTPTVPTNLALCFPSLDSAERDALARRYYRRYGQALMDVGLAWFGSRARLQREVRIIGGEHYAHARSEGRAVILLAPHYVGLEIAWARLSSEWPLTCMYRQSRNPLLQSAILNFRTRFDGRAVERYGNLGRLVRELRAGRGFYYLPDQDPDRRGDSFVFAPFFGVPAATFTALGRLAQLANAVVIPCITRQLPCGNGYVVTLDRPLADFPTGDQLKDTSRMNAAIEAGVRRAPEQYFWSYRRFKTRPDNALSPYRR
jgi:KDO2-lipid IV(A) lauroyltransferase